MRASRLVLVLLLAVAAGLVAGLVKGDDPGMRGALGNLSTPWLLIALVPAWWSGSTRRGLVVGPATTLAGLVGFYVAMTISLHAHLGMDLTPLAALRYVVSANRIWFEAALVSGPVCGALAGALGARLRSWWLGVIAGGLMVAEIVAVRAVQGARVPGLGVGWAVDDWRAYEVEAAAGLVVVVLSLFAWRPTAARLEAPVGR